MTDPDELPEHEHEGKVSRMIDCHECQGTGWRCYTCHGRGFYKIWATPAEWAEEDEYEP